MPTDLFMEQYAVSRITNYFVIGQYLGYIITYCPLGLIMYQYNNIDFDRSYAAEDALRNVLMHTGLPRLHTFFSPGFCFLGWLITPRKGQIFIILAIFYIYPRPFIVYLVWR